MTNDKWQRLSKQELLQRARRKGIARCRTLTKEELIAALAALAPVKHAKSAKSAKTGKNGRSSARKKALLRSRPQFSAAQNSNGTSAEETIERSKYDIGVPTRDLSAKVPKDLPHGYGKDRIVCMVRDPYWLHCYWEITRHAIQRAEAALAQAWHGARPILRLLEISTGDTTNTSESIVRDIDIHGGANNWYVEVHNPPRTYRIDIGYLSRGGQFYVLARSNIVATPRAGMSDVIDENWADLDGESARRIYAMSAGFDPTASSLELKQLFEERLRRPMGSPAVTSFGSGAFQFGKQRGFWFQLDAELIVYGATEPTAKVTLQGEPIKLRSDGTFTMRFSLPDSRQIIPAVAMSADGVEERTIVLAVERNTKHLEPVINEMNE
jgi:hypothetical protein